MGMKKRRGGDCSLKSFNRWEWWLAKRRSRKAAVAEEEGFKAKARGLGILEPERLSKTALRGNVQARLASRASS